MPGARRALAVAAFHALLAAPSFAASGEVNDTARWSRLAAQTYLERAERAEQRGDTLSALRAYTEALRIDPSLGRAYFGLAELRRLLGDMNEAERLLSRATVLSDVRAEALTRRAQLYRQEQRDDLALADLASAAESDPTLARLRTLASVYIERRAWVAALSVWRRIAAHPELARSEPEAREVTETLSALSLLAGEADAVQHAMDEHNAVRRTLQRHARPRSQRAGIEARAMSEPARTEKLGARKLAP